MLVAMEFLEPCFEKKMYDGGSKGETDGMKHHLIGCDSQCERGRKVFLPGLIRMNTQRL